MSDLHTERFLSPSPSLTPLTHTNLYLSSQVSLRVEGDRISFSEVEPLLQEKADVLHSLGFPITDISQSKLHDNHVTSLECHTTLLVTTLGTQTAVLSLCVYSSRIIL